MSELLRWRDLLPTHGVRTGRLRVGDDILAWGVGPWVHEPDKVLWTDPTTGRPCLVVRNHTGALCGYVAVDPGHQLHGVDYQRVEHQLEAHGGLTYSAFCDDKPGGRICHIPEQGKPHNVWWFGFDCAHSGDFVPMLHGPLMRGLGIPRLDDPWAVYKGVGYVITEVQQLARQLAAYRGAGIRA